VDQQSARLASIVLCWGFALIFLVMALSGITEANTDIPVFLRLFGLILAVGFAVLPWLADRDGEKPEPERVQMKGLPLRLVLGGFALFVILVVVPIQAVGAGGGACGTIPCDVMEPDLENKASLQRGAKYFVNYCMGCHSAKFSRFERVADDLGIPHDVARETLIFGDQEIGELMTTAMTEERGKQWFGVQPPDLTLVARSRNPEWLYTYLRNFYRDDSRPWGVNNRVFENVGMPHVMLDLQGLLECAPGPELDSHGHTKRDATGNPVIDEECGKLEPGDIEGSMSAEEFDRAIYDLVNFLEYLGEPAALERKRMGVFVLLFLSVLFVFTYLLNREYWKGIH